MADGGRQGDNAVANRRRTGNDGRLVAPGRDRVADQMTLRYPDAFCPAHRRTQSAAARHHHRRTVHLQKGCRGGVWCEDGRATAAAAVAADWGDVFG